MRKRASKAVSVKYEKRVGDLTSRYQSTCLKLFARHVVYTNCSRSLVVVPAGVCNNE